MAPIVLTGATPADGLRYLTTHYTQFVTGVTRAKDILDFYEAALVHGTDKYLRYRNDQLPPNTRVLSPEAEIFLKGLRAMFSESTTKRTLSNAKVAVDVAALTLVHTAFEEFLLKLMRLGSAMNRAGAVSRVGGKAAGSLSVVREKGLEALETEAIEKWLRDSDRMPMLDRWGAVLSLTPPPPGKTEYDSKFLEDFDAARHDAVHRKGPVAGFDVPQGTATVALYGKLLHDQHAVAYNLASAGNPRYRRRKKRAMHGRKVAPSTQS